MTNMQSPDLNAPIQPRSTRSPVPLSDFQKIYWNSSLRPAPLLRASAVRILGPFDERILRNSITVVVERHESLRTSIALVNGTPHQRIGERDVRYPMEVVDLTYRSTTHIADESRRIALEFFGRKIDACTQPLFSALLLKITALEHVLLIALEHFVGDALSCGILNREIWVTYDQICHDMPLSLPPLTIQFPDYASWQDATFKSRRSRHEAYWNDHLRGMPRLEIPSDADPSEPTCSTSAVVNLPFGKKLSDALRAVAQREKTLFPLVVLTGFIAVVSRWCGQSDVAIQLISHRRHRRPELQNMIGWLAWPLILRIPVFSTTRLMDLLKLTHYEFLSATEHEDFLPSIPDDGWPDVTFNWGGLVTYSARWSIRQQRQSTTSLQMQPFVLREDKLAKFYTNFSDTPSGVVVTTTYKPWLISHKAIGSLGTNLRLVLEELVRNPSTAVGEIYG